MKKLPTNAFLTLICLLMAYFLSFVFKVSTTIVMPIFQQQMNLSASVVGLISGMFFIPYAAMQILTAPVCKKIGVRLTIAICLGCAFLGSLLFAYGRNALAICLGRLLQGLGFGPVFIGVLFFLQENVKSTSSYSKILGISLMISNLGSVSASAPMSTLIASIGVQKTFLLLSIVLGVLFLLLLILNGFRDRSAVVAYEPENLFQQITSSCRLIIHSPAILACVFLWISYDAVSMCYILWGTTWTSVAFPSQGSLASLAITILCIGIMAGSLASEYVRSRKFSRSKSISNLSIILFLCFSLLPFSRNFGLPIPVSLVVDFLTGFMLGHMTIQISALIREKSNISHNANIMGFCNFISSLGVQLFQWLSGVSIDAFGKSTSPSAAFSWTFAILAAFFLISVLNSFRIRRE